MRNEGMKDKEIEDEDDKDDRKEERKEEESPERQLQKQQELQREFDPEHWSSGKLWCRQAATRRRRFNTSTPLPTAAATTSTVPHSLHMMEIESEVDAEGKVSTASMKHRALQNQLLT